MDRNLEGVLAGAAQHEFGAVLLVRAGVGFAIMVKDACRATVPGGQGGMDLYYGDLRGKEWSEPVSLGAPINTPASEVDLTLNRDQKTLILPAKREDSIGGSTGLYVSRFQNAAWSALENLGPRINTPATDTCPWLGFDGRTHYVPSEWDGLVAGKNGPLWPWKFEHSGGEPLGKTCREEAFAQCCWAWHWLGSSAQIVTSPGQLTDTARSMHVPGAILLRGPRFYRPQRLHRAYACNADRERRGPRNPTVRPL